MSSFLPSFLSSSEESTDDEPVEAMPKHALIGMVEDLRHDIDSIELEAEQHELILEQLEALDQMVPGKEADHKIEAYPPEERTVRWLEWIEERLADANIAESQLHRIIETRVIELADTVDDELPIDPTTTDTETWEYKFIELEVEQSGHYEMLSAGVTYDVLADAVAEFRADHSDYLDERSAASDSESPPDIETVAEDKDTTEAAAPDDEDEPDSPDSGAPSVITEDGTEIEPSAAPASEPQGDVTDDAAETTLTDRVSSLSESLPSLSGSEHTNTPRSEGSQPELTTQETDQDDGLPAWKINLLEHDPDPAAIDDETVMELIDAGYLETDGDNPDIETFAGPNAREMLEAHGERPNDPIWLGRGTNGKAVPIDQSSMFLHMMIAGKTGFGKSTQMFNMALQTIRAGYGCVVYDPGGDDSKELMEKIPENRIDDVVWIEPGKEDGYSTGFNFLQIGLDEDDPNYEKAVENLVDDLAKTLGQDEYWGPVMRRVSRSLIRAMNASKHDFNLLDLNYILLDQDSRERFRDIVEQEGIDWLDDSMRDIAEKDDEDLEPLRRRFEEWRENPIARRLISFRDGGVNIADAVENDKIIIVRMGSEGEDLKQMLMMAVLRRVWAAIRSRENEDAKDRDPFFVYMDEFHNLVPDDHSDSTIPTMFREARKFRLSLVIADQYYSEIPDHILTGINVNTDTVLSFNPGHIDQAREIAPTLDEDPQTLLNEGKYKSWTRLTVSGGNKTPAFKVHNLAPYPPVRRRETAENLIEQSLRKYGRNLSTEQIKSEMKFKAGRGELEVRGVAGDDATTDPEYQQQDGAIRDTLFESIYVTQIKQDAKGGFVPLDAVKAEWEQRAGDLGYKSKPAQILEGIPEEYVITENRSAGLFVCITADGLEAAGLTQNTGENASGGGEIHRLMLSQAFEAFTVMGCFVELPDQGDDGELPDGIATLPVDPVERVKQSDDPRAFNKALDKLESEYPALYELTDGRNISIEAEKSTIANPIQTLTNLRKAVNNGRFCVLAVKPPTNNGRAPDGADFEYWVRRGEQIIYQTERSGTHINSINRDEITCVRQTTAAGHRQFYNGDPLVLDDEIYPLRPDTEENVEWWERDGEIVVETEGGETIATFEDVWALAEPDKGAFPAYAVRDDNGELTVYESGTTHEYEDEDMMEQDWSTISEPFIPELEFDQTLPSKDDFAFVVFPLADSAVDEPVIVEGDERQPLLPEDQSLPTTNVAAAPDPNQPTDEERDTNEEGAEEADASDREAEAASGEATPTDETDSKDDEQPLIIDNTQSQNGADITAIEDLTVGGTAAVCGVIRSMQPPETIKRPDEQTVDPIRKIRIEDDTGEVQARLWGRHAEFDAEQGKEILIAGAVISGEIMDGSMTRIVDVHASDTIVDAPESISSGLPVDSTAADSDQVAVSDGAVDNTESPEQRGADQNGADDEDSGEYLGEDEDDDPNDDEPLLP